MFFKKKIELVSPISGETVKLEHVKDEVFSKKLMGDGMGVLPHKNCVIAPISGTITALVDTQHAIGMTTDDGIEIIIHVGLDTVKLAGQGFKCFVKMNDKISKGMKLIEFDENYLGKEEYDMTTIIVLPEVSNKKVKLVDIPCSVVAGESTIITLV